MEEYTSCFVCLHHLWKDNKKKEFSDKIQHALMIAEDPYKLALVCLKLCPDLYKNKGNGMAANVVVELQSFLNEHKEKYTSCLTEGMQKEVFQVAIKQKNTGMMRLLIKAYQLEDISEHLISHLRDMIAQQRYKDVCTLATLLNLQEHFSTGELIIPLFCLDRLCLADEFLDSSPAHQKEILIFIDDLIGKQAEAQHVLKKFNIKDVKKFKSSKVLSNTAARLLKRFKLDMSICPHLYRRRAVGGLRFLFYKYYIEKGLQPSAFHSLVEDAVKESPDLKMNLMYLFCEYCDPYAAVPYITKLQLHSDDLPHQVKKAMLTSPPGNNSHLATNKPQEEEECWGGQDDNESYSLSLSLEKVIVVDTVSGFEDCVKDVCRSTVIGLDSEWKPSFGIGAAEQVALLQLATLTHVFLIDIVSLQPLLNHCHWSLLGQIFSDNRITKLGYGIKGDFKILAKVHTEFKKALANAKNVIDFDQKKAVLLEAQPDMFSFSPSSYKGLSDLVYRCFGQPLNKNEQFSNWSNRPLTRSQELYAALDARCLIDIYNYLNAKAQELNIDDWINMKAPQAKSKNSKKMKVVASGSKNFFPDESKQRPVTAKEFHVVCDAMLQGLAKKLRLCGVDAIALENGQSSDDCIEFFEKDKRVVLSRGAAYQRLRKFIPSGYVYHVENEGANLQLAEVMKTFQIFLSPEDLFARCTKCNSGSYLSVPSSVIREMQKIQENSQSIPDKWVTCEGGKINLSSGLTEYGVKVKVETVRHTVIEKVEKFYVCAQCGICYWEGSHQERAFKDIICQFMYPDNRETDVPNLTHFAKNKESQRLDKLMTEHSTMSLNLDSSSDTNVGTSFTDSDSEVTSVHSMNEQLEKLGIGENDRKKDL